MTYARSIAENVVSDIREADKRFKDRPELGASGTMYLLSEDMQHLVTAGIPPVSNKADYHALVSTLGQFYAKAANQLPDNVTGAAATYTVCRQKTAGLLGILNPVLGTTYKLGKWSFL